MNMKYVLSTTLLMSATALAGCASSGATFNGELNETTRMHEPDTGVVIAQTKLVGEAVATDIQNTSSDCEGTYGYGLEVETVKGDTRYLFDKGGMPCADAKTIFDGDSPLSKRAADPSIKIQFRDVYGTVEDDTAELVASYVAPQMSAATPEEFALTDDDGAAADIAQAQIPAPRQGMTESEVVAQVIRDAQGPNFQEPGKGPIYNKEQDASVYYPSTSQGLTKTITSWEDDAEYQALAANAETLLANVRDLQRMSNNELLSEHQNQIRALMTDLRSAQRQNEYHLERERLFRKQIEELQLELDAQQIDREQVERKLEKTQEATAQKAREYKDLAQKLEREKSYAEQSLQTELAMNRKQVHEAEKQADHARQRMIYEAALKIAEAEEQAKMAMMAQRNAMEREVVRRSLDARHIAHRASDLESGRAIVLPAMPAVSQVQVGAQSFDRLQSKAPAVDSAVTKVDGEMKVIVLENLGVSLREENASLKGIFDRTLTQLSDRVGEWEVVWNLEERNRTIPNEKWSILAETTMGDFLAYVQSKVKETHGATLQFRRFDEARLFVVTDKENE